MANVVQIEHTLYTRILFDDSKAQLGEGVGGYEIVFVFKCMCIKFILFGNVSGKLFFFYK